MTNLLKKTSLGLAAAAALILSGAAHAAVICAGCSYVDPLVVGGDVNQANNLGTHNPLTGDNSTFNHGGLGNGNFWDWWVFTINPAGLGSVNAIFIPGDNLNTFITGFNVDLYKVSASTCAANAPAAVGLCTSVTTMGGPIATANAGTGFSMNIPLQPLSGTYAFFITGVSSNSVGSPSPNSNSYTGNVTTRRLVPEPGSLALAAMGLLVAGGVLRRRT